MVDPKRQTSVDFSFDFTLGSSVYQKVENIQTATRSTIAFSFSDRLFQTILMYYVVITKFLISVSTKKVPGFENAASPVIAKWNWFGSYFLIFYCIVIVSNTVYFFRQWEDGNSRDSKWNAAMMALRTLPV